MNLNFHANLGGGGVCSLPAPHKKKIQFANWTLSQSNSHLMHSHWYVTLEKSDYRQWDKLEPREFVCWITKSILWQLASAVLGELVVYQGQARKAKNINENKTQTKTLYPHSLMIFFTATFLFSQLSFNLKKCPKLYNDSEKWMLAFPSKSKYNEEK